MGNKLSNNKTSILTILGTLVALIATVFIVFNITYNTPGNTTLPDSSGQSSNSPTKETESKEAFSEALNNPNSEKVYTAEIRFNSTTIQTTVAATPQQRAQGLSYTESLPEGEGVLFVWPGLTTPVFNTVHMNYNIDIIWVDENNMIVGFVENVPPHPETTYNPDVPVMKVIETNAGFVKKHDIRKGETIIIIQTN